MDIKTKNFLRGVGSVIEIAPSRNLLKMVQRNRRSGAERMASHFTHAGASVSRACKLFNNNVSTTVTKTKKT